MFKYLQIQLIGDNNVFLIWLYEYSLKKRKKWINLLDNIQKENINMKKILLALTLLIISNASFAYNPCNCQGYSGPGGPCYDGPGGPAYAGPGGPAYAGPGGPCYAGPGGNMYSGPGGNMYSGPGGNMYAGPGGPAYAGPGGPAYDGPGGPCYAGPGGPCYNGPGGGWKCPSVCGYNK